MPVKEKRSVAGDGAASGAGSGPVPPSSPKVGGSSPFSLYKSGQGTYVRWGTALGTGVIVVGGAQFLYEQLYALENTRWQIWQILIPVVVMVALAYLTFWMVGRKRGMVDFLIATEGEMKKVNWSSRQEVIGATKVVIVTMLMMGLLLFIADMICIFVFSGIGIIKIDLIAKLFGGSSG